MNINDRVNEIFNELVEIRRDFHKNPELSNKEFRTQAKIQEYLNQWGIENYVCAETGVVGIIRGKNPGKTVAIRGDIDALPIQEQNDVPYKSVNPGVMHACGHDAHPTVVLGIGKIMKELADSEESINGNVKLFFQPAEEASGGAERMIQEGCMENPTVDYVLGLHVMGTLDAGKVQFKYGKLNASTDAINIMIKGKSAHGAHPNKGTDAIVIASNVVLALQTIVSRNTSPTDSIVISLGKISGGVKENVIADEVKISGTLRALDDESRQYTKDRIAEIVSNVAKAYGGEGITTFKEGYKSLINHNEIIDILKENAESLLGKENVEMGEFPSLGAEDFGYFLDKAKGAFFQLGTSDTKKGISYVGHTEYFDIDEEGLKVGVRLQIENILTLLNR